MKTLILLAAIIVLTGCSLSTSRDVKHAEKMLSYFQCNNIETAQMAHSSITSYHEQSLASSRQKAESYVQSYKDGDKLFDVPLTEVVEEQYFIYQEACQHLGGIRPTQAP
ncbi:hypothetical protein B9T29_06895 [Acinetobacter sp. ANC 3903]|uniref:hypothetical protein n=1 Tax=Acinetobacter sp. ANC 3903 TaxID=1977883 RepID=UPI000A34DA13|nr:hypothetical protein [Acinetobacter sp. ANC 3903]OTG62511.1 hypothetical protein B9T29_06895 [Acinetobacter sp. ANC 3903]